MAEQSFKTIVSLAVWRDKSLSTHEKCLLNYLIFRMNNINHNCWPSQKTIAEETGMSLKTVNTIINRLKKAGWIIQRKKLNKKYGQGWALSEYIIKLPIAKGSELITQPFNKANVFNGQGIETEVLKVEKELPTNYIGNYTKNYENSFNKDPTKLKRLEDSAKKLNEKIRLEKESKALKENKKIL